MSLYNMLFGQNPQSDLLLAVVGLRRGDIERLRDVSVADDGRTIEVYTRTGGGNREDYPNDTMRHRPEWRTSVDDDFDSTYCTDRLTVPDQFVADVAHLGDLLQHGLRAEFAQHLALTLQRSETDADKRHSAYEADRAGFARLSGVMANGHTFVPYDDTAMEGALKLAEANGGTPISCWRILPLTITVKHDFKPYPGAKPPGNEHLVRVELGYAWTIDTEYWAHCQARFADAYPKAMAEVADGVARLRKAA